MENETAPFRTHAVKPFECYSRGWLLIKDQYWLFLLIYLVAMFIGSAVPLGILLGPMMCGVYICLFKKNEGQTISFDMLFKGFSYFVESLLATLMMIVPMLILIIPIVIAFIAYFILAAHAAASRNTPGPLFASMFGGQFILVAVLILVTSLIGLFFVFAYPLIVDRGLKAWPAVKMSFRGAWHNLGGMILLILLNLLLGFAGMLVCYVGVFFVGPILMAALFTAYRQVFGENAAGGEAEPATL